MEQLKVIVVGAVMGGLTTALALSQAGYQVEVYDRVKELRPAGAGVSLWSNGVKVLNRLGLGRRLAAIGGLMQRVCYRASDGRVLTDFSLQPLIERVGERPYPVARTDLQQMLLDAVGAERVTLEANCVHVEQDGESATAVFEDGRRATGDLVVAADGTHSVLRKIVLGRTAPRRYAGYVNWNGLVSQDANLTPPATWVVYVGNHQRASLMPVGGDRFYFFFDVPLALGLPSSPAGNAADTRAELARHFDGWAAPVAQLIQRLDPETTNRIEIHDVEPLERLVSGRVVLLGDAAHSTTPDLGQGGCQAMEDAWVLANVLLTTNIGVEDALRRYEAARLPRTSEIVRRARARADMTHGVDPQKTQEWYEELAHEDGARILHAIGNTILSGPLG